MKRILTPQRALMLFAVLTLLAFKALSCDGGMTSCGGTSSGMRTLEYAEYPNDEKISGMAQIRLTGGPKGGLAFLAKNTVPLLEAALGGSLSFPIEPIEVGNWWGSCKVCESGCNLTLRVDHVDVTPSQPDKLTIDIYLPRDFAISVPAECGALGSSSWVQCNVGADTNGAMYQLSLDVTFATASDTRQLDVIVGEPRYDINGLDVEMSGTFIVCTTLAALADSIKPLLASTIKTQVKNIVNQAVEGFKCLTCKDKPCPATDVSGHAVTCDDNQVCRKGDNSCLLTTLGIDMEVDLGSLIASMFPGLQAKIWASYAAGGRAGEVIAQPGEDLGMEVGLFGSSMMAPGSPAPDCSATVTFPRDDLPRIPMGNFNAHISATTPYQVGIGLREELLDQIGYTLQNSGLLCLQIDGSMPGVGDYLSAPNIALLLPSLSKLTHSENAPMAIKLQPGPEPIDFAIIDPQLVFPENPELQSALQIRIRDLSLHFWVLIEGRPIRVITMQVDIDVSAGLSASPDTTGGSVLQVVFGLDNVKISNFRVPFSVLGEEPAKVATTLEGLLGTVLGQVALDPIDPIAIPGIDINSDDTPDLFIQIQTIAGETPKVSAPIGENEYRSLVVYAGISLASAHKGKPAPFKATTYAGLVAHSIPTVAEYEAGELPWVRLALSGRDADGSSANLEYQYAVDGGAYTPWSRETSPVLKSARWMLQGRHEILVHARDRRYGDSTDIKQQRLSFITDYTAPALTLLSKEDLVVFKGSDNVATADELDYRYRVAGGAWSAWSKVSKVPTSLFGARPATIEVEVRDLMGLTAGVTRRLEAASTRLATRSQTPLKGTNAAVVTPAAAESGCQSNASALSLGLLLSLGLGLFVLRRRASRALPIALMLGLALFAMACSSGSHSSGCKINADCPAGNACVSGICKPVTIDGDQEFDIPEGDADSETEAEPDNTESAEEIPCKTTADCPDPGCYFCSATKKVCKVQECSPTCEKAAELGIDTPCGAREGNDSCEVCNTEATTYSCKQPRCLADADCGCRVCDTAKGEHPYCQSNGACGCSKPCGGCPDLTTCCNVLPLPPYVPSDATCVAYPNWCEGKTCPDGFQAGTCNPQEQTDPAECAWAALWHYDQPNFDATTCKYTGVGTIDDASCACVEKPPLTMGFYGRFNDLAVFNNDKVWLTAYNDTYGDLLVGQTTVADMALDPEARLTRVSWLFLDGVPELPPTGGPSGPRGGIKEPGANVGKYSSLALSAEGWPRIAYQDTDEAKLVFIYTDGETVEPVDGDADLPAEDGDTAEVADTVEAEADAGTEPTPTKRARKDDTTAAPALAWTKIVIDDTGLTGLYTDTWIDPQGRPVIAYMTSTDQVDETTPGTSALKLAWARTAKPASAADFVIYTIDSAPVGPAANKAEHLPFGTGLKPTLAPLPDGQLWIFYYHHTTYETRGETADNYKVGYLKRAKLNGNVSALTESPEGASFAVETYLGATGSLVVGDVGSFNSFAVMPDKNWYAVAFYNATLNQLQYVYDFGDQPRLRTADDGWRRDNQNRSFQVRLGADADVKIDGNGYIRITYQDQSRSKLLYYSEQCIQGSCIDRTLQTLLQMSDGIDGAGFALDYGRSYGYFVKQVIVNGVVSLISSYSVNTTVKPEILRVDLSTAPSAKR